MRYSDASAPVALAPEHLGLAARRLLSLLAPLSEWDSTAVEALALACALEAVSEGALLRDGLARLGWASSSCAALGAALAMPLSSFPHTRRRGRAPRPTTLLAVDACSFPDIMVCVLSGFHRGPLLSALALEPGSLALSPARTRESREHRPSAAEQALWARLVLTPQVLSHHASLSLARSASRAVLAQLHELADERPPAVAHLLRARELTQAGLALVLPSAAERQLAWELRAGSWPSLGELRSVVSSALLSRAPLSSEESS